MKRVKWEFCKKKRVSRKNIVIYPRFEVFHQLLFNSWKFFKRVSHSLLNGSTNGHEAREPDPPNARWTSVSIDRFIATTHGRNECASRWNGRSLLGATETKRVNSTRFILVGQRVQPLILDREKCSKIYLFFSNVLRSVGIEKIYFMTYKLNV